LDNSIISARIFCDQIRYKVNKGRSLCKKMQNYRSKGPDFPQEILGYMKVFTFPL